MSVRVEDFLPKYPNIVNTPYENLNPYKGSFNQELFRKKEFYDNRLERSEEFPAEKGMLMKYQQTIVKYLSSNTPYEGLLVVHSMGSGKCVLPETKIYVNGESVMIKDFWKKEFKPEMIILDGLGDWLSVENSVTVSFDEETGGLISGDISKIYRQLVDEELVTIETENHKITCTKKHRLLTEKGWRKFDKQPDIKYLFGIKDGKIRIEKITNISWKHYTGFVYDLEVEELHNYIANDIITHNTCSAIGTIEQIKNEKNNFDGAMIFAKGDRLLDNFKQELVEKCTAGQYMPADYKNLTALEKTRRINKKTAYYEFNTFERFGKKIKKMSDKDIIQELSNKIIVIDEVHNIRLVEKNENKADAIETYKSFHRMLHLIKNCKILLLSGTPMKDSPEEIADVLNLILPQNEQLPTGAEFQEKYLVKKDNVPVIKPEKVQDFKNKIKGRVSFLREAQSTIPKKFIGKKIGTLRHFIVNPVEMSEFQQKYYDLAFKSDQEGKQGVYNNSREASLFVYPDGSYGKAGFEKYIVKKGTYDFSMKQELSSVIKGKDRKATLENIKKFSAVYYDTMKRIVEANGNCFVYSSLVKGSGCILFSLILELLGFSRSKGRENSPELRYAILSNTTGTTKELRLITELFNSDKNKHGEYIKVIIGSKTVSEGFSFKNVIFEAINTPHWNYSETDQAIARGIRLGSHNAIINENPVVEISQTVAIPKDGTSLDLFMYETSEDKDVAIRGIIRLLMEGAFDCALNYMRNKAFGQPKTRECDYLTCDYKCDGIDMVMVNEGLDEKELDYSTYQLYYSNPKIPEIRKKIEKLFRQYEKIDMDSIIKNLKSDDITEEEIQSALFLIQTDAEKQMDYRDFLKSYSRSAVKKISDKIEELFREFFVLDIQTIFSENPGFTQFEIVSALHTMISESILLSDKFGLPCYLREYKDSYFLVNSLTVVPDFFTEYYTENPNINGGKTFEELMGTLFKFSIPTKVEKICSISDEEKIIELLESLPLRVQEMFLETSIIAEKQGVETNKELRRIVLQFYNTFIKEVDGMKISILLDKEGVLRCFDGVEWKNCDTKFVPILQELEAKSRQELYKSNPYGIIGKYNKDAFCIVDFLQEKQAREKIGQVRKTAGEDKRLQYAGKVCSAGGWKIPELVKIMAIRLKINPPEKFRKGETKEDMIKDMRSEKKLIPDVVNESEIPDLTEQDVKRILYWGTKSKGAKGGIRNICSSLQDWLRENGLLYEDNQCGKQGKVQGVRKVVPESTKVYSTEIIIPVDRQEEFKSYVKDIQKILKESKKETSVPIDDSMWVLSLSKRKLIGFAVIDKNNIIKNLCVQESYRRRGIASVAMRQALKTAKGRGGKKATLYLENTNKNFKKLFELYSTIGFKVTEKDEKNTKMQLSDNL
jgi:hypothetical protein